MKKIYTTEKVLRSKLAFTMTEILISLTIIGVIAAITMPALRANINDSAMNTKRKALYTRISQAIGMMGHLGGYGLGDTDEATIEKAAMAFVTEGLSKVLKINNICDKDNLPKCGLPLQYTTMNNYKINFPKVLGSINANLVNNDADDPLLNTDAVGIETVNGESIAVFYNPFCKPVSENDTYIRSWLCANFIYDLNGKKGPNMVGKDIGFITAVGSRDSIVVAPMPLASDASDFAPFNAALNGCETQNSDSRLPNLHELASMCYNIAPIYGAYGSKNLWSSSKDSAGNALEIRTNTLILSHINDLITTGKSVRCIKR